MLLSGSSSHDSEVDQTSHIDMEAIGDDDDEIEDDEDEEQFNEYQVSKSVRFTCEWKKRFIVCQLSLMRSDRTSLSYVGPNCTTNRSQGC